MKLRVDKDRMASYLFLSKWIFLATVAGLVGSCAVGSFRFLLNIITFHLSYWNLPLPVWSLCGAVLTGAVIYRIEPEAAGEGIPSYMVGISKKHGHLPFRPTVLKYGSALATLATFGNGGIVGPMGRFASGIMSALGGVLRKVGFSEEDQRTAAICGMAATVGSIFHSPIGGGIFAVEILERTKMGYKDLFPAILSSIVGVSFSKALGWGSFYSTTVSMELMDLSRIGLIVLLAVILGAAGGLYTRLYSLIVKLFRRERGNVTLKVTIGTLIASWPAWFLNPSLLGTSRQLFQAIFTDDSFHLSGILAGKLPLALILIIMSVLKAFFNCITVGSGMSAGFTGPSVLIGLLLGSAFAHIFNIPVTSPDFHAFLAAGLAGMLASSMNVPLAAAVLSVEIFGLNSSLPAALAAIIGFQINRHHTIYDYALAGSGSIHPQEPDLL